MEKFYLEAPSISRKEEAIEYISEFINNDSQIHGSGGLDRYLQTKTYEEWLIHIKNMKNKEYALACNFVPSTTYFLIRKDDNKIIGMIDLRHELNEYLAKIGGHIGYGIRPLERRKGYAKIQLYLCLIKAKELGLEKVMISCDKTNIASAKTIEALGGIFKSKEKTEKDKISKIYWIDVNKSLEKYKYYLKDKPEIK